MARSLWTATVSTSELIVDAALAHGNERGYAVLRAMAAGERDDHEPGQ